MKDPKIKSIFIKLKTPINLFGKEGSWGVCFGRLPLFQAPTVLHAAVCNFTYATEEINTLAIYILFAL